MGRKHDLAHRIISPIYIGPEGRIVFIQMTFKSEAINIFLRLAILPDLTILQNNTYGSILP